MRKQFRFETQKVKVENCPAETLHKKDTTVIGEKLFRELTTTSNAFLTIY